MRLHAHQSLLLPEPFRSGKVRRAAARHTLVSCAYLADAVNRLPSSAGGHGCPGTYSGATADSSDTQDAQNSAATAGSRSAL